MGDVRSAQRSHVSSHLDTPFTRTRQEKTFSHSTNGVGGINPGPGGSLHSSKSLPLSETHGKRLRFHLNWPSRVGCRTWWGSSNDWCRRRRRGAKAVDGARTVTVKYWPRSCSSRRRVVPGSSCPRHRSALGCDSPPMIPRVEQGPRVGRAPPLGPRRARRPRQARPAPAARSTRST